MSQHVCLSADPTCTGLSPCAFCWDTIRIRTLPRAMTLAGGPFLDPEWGPTFLAAFHQAWREIGEEARQYMRPTNAAQAQAQTLNANEATAIAEDAEAARAAAQAEPVVLPDGTVLHEVEEKKEGEIGYPVDEKRMASYLNMMGAKPTTQEDVPVAEAPRSESEDSEFAAPTIDGRRDVVDTPSGPAGGLGQAGLTSTDTSPKTGSRVNAKEGKNSKEQSASTTGEDEDTKSAPNGADNSASTA